MVSLTGRQGDDEGGALYEQYIHTISYFANVIQFAKEGFQTSQINGKPLIHTFLAFLNWMIQIGQNMGSDIDISISLKLLTIMVENLNTLGS